MRLEPLCTFTARLSKTELVATTPLGRRIIGPIHGATLTGERVRAVQRGTSAADWLVMGPDGTVQIDVRLVFVTDDGARLYLEYLGRADWSGGVMSGPVYSVPTFSTDDPRYSWLNSVQCAARGQVRQDGADYEMFVLR